MSQSRASTAAHLSRRGFLVLGGSGAAATVLSACGSESDPRDEGEDPRLLEAVAGAEAALQREYESLALGAEGADVKRAIADAQTTRATELGKLGASTAQGEPATDAIGAQNAAIVAYRELARLGSTEELRRAGMQFAAQIAAELALVRELDGEDPVPYAFVTGLDEAPLENPE